MKLHAVVEGKVQGVFFRAFVKENADILNLTGWVKNNADGSVELVAEGAKEKLNQLLDKCRRGPPAAEVGNVEHEWQDSVEEFSSFDIKR